MARIFYSRKKGGKTANRGGGCGKRIPEKRANRKEKAVLLKGKERAKEGGVSETR